MGASASTWRSCGHDPGRDGAAACLLALTGSGGLGRAADGRAARDLAVQSPPVVKTPDGKIEARIYLDAATVGVTEASLTRLDVAPGAVMALHVHGDATEVLYVISGEGDLSRSKTKTHLGPGQAVMVPAGAVHGFTAGASSVELIQFFLAGGPEQSWKEKKSPGTPAADATPAGSAPSRDIELLDGTTAPRVTWARRPTATSRRSGRRASRAAI
ncbi:MAG: cupin domain-containing protein [Acidobacteriota bacterium]